MPMIKSLSYVVLKSADLPAWRTFACEVLGLMEADGGGGDRLMLRLDDRPFRILVEAGDAEGFVAAGWELGDADSYRRTLEALSAEGFEISEASEREARDRSVKALARTTDPSGTGVELHWGRVVDYTPFLSPAGVSGFVTEEMGLGHVVLPASDLAASLNFYKKHLGFADTDYISVPLSPDPDGPSAQVHFLHCDNPRHHSIALTDMPQPSGAVHVMVEARTLDDVGYALDRVKASGAHLSASLGRHTNDRMVSFYVRTPGGFDIEFGTGGWQVDWSRFVPTISLKDSAWGHEWNFVAPES
jgi:3,4-dihydroxy-9,10-secoandrosta-1,3,5(10)-triene-9,17-dione 4,5-dioxygenase